MVKASDNPYPSVLLEEGTAPATPAAGFQRIFVDTADGLIKRIDDTGTITVVGAGAALTVQDENSNVATNVSQIDFQGAGVTVTAGTGEVIVTIPGGAGITVQDENGTVATGVTQIDFQGAGVTATAGSGEIVVTIPSTSAVQAGAKAKRAAAFNLTTVGYNQIVWDGTEFDTDGYWASGNPSRLTVPAGKGGLHLVSFNFGTPDGWTASKRVMAEIRKNGSAVVQNELDTPMASCFNAPSASVALDLAAGDYVEGYLYQNDRQPIAMALGTSSLSALRFASGGVKGSHKKRTSGSVTVTTTAWGNFDTGLDMVLPAQAGDLVEVVVSGTAGDTNSNYLILDAASIVAGSPVNYWGKDGAESATSYGVLAWACTGSQTIAGGGIARNLVSGDISGGTVTIRLRTRLDSTSPASKSMQASADVPFRCYAINHGQ